MGTNLNKRMYLLRRFYPSGYPTKEKRETTTHELAPQPKAPPKLRERDWLVLSYIALYAVDPDSKLGQRIRREHDRDPDDFKRRGRHLPGQFRRRRENFEPEVLANVPQPTDSSYTQVAGCLRRLEANGLIRIIERASQGYTPLVQVLIDERCRVLGVLPSDNQDSGWEEASEVE